MSDQITQSTQRQFEKEKEDDQRRVADNEKRQAAQRKEKQQKQAQIEKLAADAAAHDLQNKQKQTKAAEPHRTETVKRAEGNATNTHSEAQASSRPKEFKAELPDDFKTQKKWPVLVPAAMVQQLPADGGRTHDPIISVSPLRHFAFIDYKHHYRHPSQTDGHIWRITDGTEVTAKSSECDYFSIPNSISPDETAFGTIDGQILRIWNVTTTPASLLKSIALPRSMSVHGGPITSPFTITWMDPSNLLIIWRAPGGEEKLQFVRKDKSNEFALAELLERGQNQSGQNKGDWNQFNGNPSFASLNGRFVVRQATNSKEQLWALSIRDMSNGRETRALESKRAPFAPVGRRAGSKKTVGGYKRYPDHQEIRFSPNSEIVTVPTSDQELKILKTDTWKEIATITGTSFNEPVADGFSLGCFSPDSKLFIISVDKAYQSSRDLIIKRSLVVFDSHSGKQLQSIDIGEEFAGRNNGNKGTRKLKTVTFTDARTVLVEDSQEWYESGNNQQKNSWSLSSLEAATGKINFRIDLPDEQLNPSEKQTNLPPEQLKLHLTSGGRFCQTIHGPRGSLSTLRLNLWDVQHLAEIAVALQHGDACWEKGEKAKAFASYRSILGDKLTSIVWRHQQPRLLSRCVDYYVEKGDTANATQVLGYSFLKKISLTPETFNAKKFAEQFIAERNEEIRKQSQESHELNEKHLAALRAKNQRDRVPARTLTKKEFINKLREKMDKGGRIDENFQFGNFTNYTFQDSFGEPDSNIDWTDSWRRVSFRCSDGMVALTVIYFGHIVSLKGVDQY